MSRPDWRAWNFGREDNSFALARVRGEAWDAVPLVVRLVATLGLAPQRDFFRLAKSLM
jgi:hypothetical protein